MQEDAHSEPLLSAGTPSPSQHKTYNGGWHETAGTGAAPQPATAEPHFHTSTLPHPQPAATESARQDAVATLQQASALPVGRDSSPSSRAAQIAALQQQLAALKLQVAAKKGEAAASSGELQHAPGT